MRLSRELDVGEIDMPQGPGLRVAIGRRTELLRLLREALPAFRGAGQERSRHARDQKRGPACRRAGPVQRCDRSPKTGATIPQMRADIDASILWPSGA